MSFMNGMGLSQMVSQFRVDNQVRTLQDIQGGAGTAGFYGITSRNMTQKALVESQNEENTTFLFEYRAYLNSQLTTLITKLSNALASDLDASMAGSFSFLPGATKPAMQGDTGVGGTDQIDPGADRSAAVFLSSFQAVTGYTDSGGRFATNSSPAGGWTATLTTETMDDGGAARTASGTRAVVSYGNTYKSPNAVRPDDVLHIDLTNLSNNGYERAKTLNGTGSGYNVTDATARGRSAGNKFEEVLFKESVKPVFRQILLAGLFEDIVVSATSSLTTGSQVQASIGLTANSGYFRSGTFSKIVNPNSSYNVNGATGGGAANGSYNVGIEIWVNRFTSFYHS